MRLAVLLAFILTFTSAFAQSRASLKREIRKLTVVLEDETYNTDADIRTLMNAKIQVQNAIKLLRDGGNDRDYRDCVKFSFEKLKQSMSDSRALDAAQKVCKSVKSFEIYTYLFEKYNANYSSKSAIEKAANKATAETKGKLSLLEFAWEKHNRNYSSSSAADKAIENIIVQNRRGALECFEEYYAIYSRNYSSSSAMDRTAQACAQ